MRRLTKVYLEITNTCNLSCRFCPPVQQKPANLDLVQFEYILSQLKGQVKTLYFHLKGEPLIHPLLGQFLQLAAASGFEVILTTNATLLTRKLADLQGQSSLKRVNISLHAWDDLEKPQQKKAFLEMLGSAQLLADPIHISLRLWDAQSRHQHGPIFELLEQHFQLAEAEIARSLQGQNATMLAPSISLHRADAFDWPRLDATLQPGPGFCQGLRDQAGILVDGTVVPCCLDADGIINLGNIYQHDWSSIIGSPRARGLRQAFDRGQVSEELCRHCSYRQRFADKAAKQAVAQSGKPRI